MEWGGGEEEACDWLRPPRLAGTHLPNPGLRSGAAYDSYNKFCYTQTDCFPPPLNPRLRSMTAYDIYNIFEIL
jgi:hypothetical protein